MTTSEKRKKWVANAFGFLKGRHGLRTEVTHLELQQIAIKPSQTILWFGAALGLMLYCSALYQINIGYVMVFWGLSTMITASWISFFNMRGLQLRTIEQDSSCAQGDEMPFSIMINDTIGKQRKCIILDIGPQKYELSVAPFASLRIDFTVTSKCRGVMKAPMLKLSSPYPMGLWDMHHLWAPDLAGIVYPKPEVNPPTSSMWADKSNQTEEVGAQDDGDSLVSMREYRQGDSPRRVAWRAWAKNDGQQLLTKQTDGIGRQTQGLWIDESYVASLNNQEQRLSRLSAWLLQAHFNGSKYGLKAQGTIIEPGSGTKHLLVCLKTLAMADGCQTTVAYRSEEK